MQIFYSFQSINRTFKSAYDGIQWRTFEADFTSWYEGKQVIQWLMQGCA
jgi:hypothetical protein